MSIVSSAGAVQGRTSKSPPTGSPKRSKPQVSANDCVASARRIDVYCADVDLHVIDPNGDEVYYGRNLSYQGGAITRDATGGYGPEEFALRNAKPGKYRVEANFFGHRQQVLASSTGLMLWLSSGFGTPAQQDQRTTLSVKSEGGQRVVVGEFEVKL